MKTKKYTEEERKVRDRASKLRWYYKNKIMKRQKLDIPLSLCLLNVIVDDPCESNVFK